MRVLSLQIVALFVLCLGLGRVAAYATKAAIEKDLEVTSVDGVLFEAGTDFFDSTTVVIEAFDKRVGAKDQLILRGHDR